MTLTPIEAIGPIGSFLGDTTAMQSNDEKTGPPPDERDAARARLARQVGRLLANEWLRTRAANPAKISEPDPETASENASTSPVSPEGQLGVNLKADRLRLSCGGVAVNSENGQSIEEGHVI
jgi:hypothetical protein